MEIRWHGTAKDFGIRRDVGVIDRSQEQEIDQLKAQRVAIDNQIAAKEQAQRSERERAEAAERNKRAEEARATFDELVEATEAERKRFADLLEQAALSLGALAHSAQLLGETYNLIAQNMAPLRDEVRLCSVRNAMRPPSDLVLDLCDRHGGTTMGTGYDWVVTIPVLKGEQR